MLLQTRRERETDRDSGAAGLRPGGAGGNAERDSRRDLARLELELGDLRVEARRADPDLERLLGAELALLARQRREPVHRLALDLALERLALERAARTDAADLRLEGLGRHLRDRQPLEREPGSLDVPLGGEARRDGRERFGDPVAVLVDAVALDLLGTRPDRRVVVIAVLAGEEPVVVVVDPERTASAGIDDRAHDGHGDRAGAG